MPRFELDQRSRGARLRLEQIIIKRLLIPRANPGDQQMRAEQDIARESVSAVLIVKQSERCRRPKDLRD